MSSVLGRLHSHMPIQVFLDVNITLDIKALIQSKRRLNLQHIQCSGWFVLHYDIVLDCLELGFLTLFIYLHNLFGLLHELVCFASILCLQEFFRIIQILILGMRQA